MLESERFEAAGGRGRGGFAQVELAAVVAVTTLLAMLMLTLGGEGRRNGRLAECVGNERALGARYAAFAADREDQVASFTWQGGETQDTQFDDLNFAEDDLQAAANQAVFIMRTLGDRPDIPQISGWIPHVQYSHLALAEHLQLELPATAMACPEDRNRLNWKDDPQGKFDQGFWLPLQPNPGSVNKKWPYSASYQLAPAAWDAGQSDPDPNLLRVSQGSGWNTYAVPDGVSLGPQSMSDVAHPAGKMQHLEPHQRHFGNERQPYFGLEEARIPLLMFDGSVAVRSTANSNPGWDPEEPADRCGEFFLYAPENAPWSPPAVNGLDGAPNADLVEGFYRWTRLGLKGIDFGGAEPDTGQGDAPCVP